MIQSNFARIIELAKLGHQFEVVSVVENVSLRERWNTRPSSPKEVMFVCFHESYYTATFIHIHTIIVLYGSIIADYKNPP